MTECSHFGLQFAGEMEGLEGHPSELITSAPLVGAFHFIITRPYCNAVLLLHAFLITTWLSAPYAEMKQQSVDLGPYNTRLKSVSESLRHDFETKDGMLYDYILIWNPERKTDVMLNRDEDFLETFSTIENHLSTLQRTEKSCKELTWGSPDYAGSDDAAVVKVEMHVRASFGHRNPCLYIIRKYVNFLNSKQGTFNLAMAGPHSVVDASYDECDEETMWHLSLSTPVLAALLIMGVGTFPRAITPFICLGGSIQASRCVIVLIKMLCEDLNMVGPDTQIVFVQLALSFDYALFFWVRFSQERLDSRLSGTDGNTNEGVRGIESSVMKTLQTSGFVILLSTMVLIVAFLGASCYPDLNKLGYLYATLNLALGTFFVGFYSLSVPTVLILILPSIFDEQKSAGFSSLFQNMTRLIKVNVFRPVGYIAASRPWNYLATFLVFVGFAPLIFNTFRFLPNYDVTRTDFSSSVPEYKAYKMIQNKFEYPAKLTVFMLASPGLQKNFTYLYAVKEFQPKSLFREAFHKAACEVAETISRDRVCKVHGIQAEDILSIDWDSVAGSCSTEPQHLSGEIKYSASNGTKQRMFLYPELDNLQGAKVQSLIQHFWDMIEPQVTIRNGNEELFSAKLYTPVAEDMLLEQQYRQACPWIVGSTMFIVCCLVAALFKSYFVAVKMVFTVALPIVAEYGFAVGVFQHGWLEWAGIPSTGGLKWTMVYSTSGFLFALAMDYDLFLFARVYERRMQGYDNASAVRIALEETGPLISLAGTIMVVSFFFVFLSTVPVIAQMGCLYCFGVAMDVYIVRLWLAPAALCIFQQANYWPGKVPKPTRCYIPDNVLPLPKAPWDEYGSFHKH